MRSLDTASVYGKIRNMNISTVLGRVQLYQITIHSSFIGGSSHKTVRAMAPSLHVGPLVYSVTTDESSQSPTDNHSDQSSFYCLHRVVCTRVLHGFHGSCLSHPIPHTRISSVGYAISAKVIHVVQNLNIDIYITTLSLS